MTLAAIRVKWTILDSELAALLTEAELIRTYQPPFNILLKDDKSPLYIAFSQDDFPLVKNVRKKEINLHKYTARFGPFQSAYQVKQVLQIARPLFKWCDLPHNKLNKPCFYFHLELCDGACCGLVSQENYRAKLKNLQLFLRGQSTELIKTLIGERKKLATELRFEQAGEKQQLIDSLLAVTKKPYQLKPDPTQILLHNNPADRVKYLQAILADHIFTPKNLPLRKIEGYDVSNVSGTLAVVSQVVFVDGQPDKNQYRSYNIRTLNSPNDFGMLQEALIRRQNHPEWGIPDAIMIDGGRGQVRSAQKVWSLSPIIGLAKRPDRLVLIQTSHKGSESKSTLEAAKIKFVEVKLKDNHPALQLLQSIRDEAHRFANSKHRRRRIKALLEN